ncbi:hypothetical protein WN51_07117, partial [Melipona quadrifasciata]
PHKVEQILSPDDADCLALLKICSFDFQTEPRVSIRTIFNLIYLLSDVHRKQWRKFIRSSVCKSQSRHGGLNVIN